MTWISVTVLLAASICFNGWRILEERETQAACEGTTLTPHIAAGPRAFMRDGRTVRLSLPRVH